jgi:hypothetical protein
MLPSARPFLAVTSYTPAITWCRVTLNSLVAAIVVTLRYILSIRSWASGESLLSFDTFRWYRFCEQWTKSQLHNCSRRNLTIFKNNSNRFLSRLHRIHVLYACPFFLVFSFFAIRFIYFVFPPSATVPRDNTPGPTSSPWTKTLKFIRNNSLNLLLLPHSFTPSLPLPKKNACVLRYSKKTF